MTSSLASLPREKKEELYRLLVEKEARAISKDFRRFISGAWHVVEPSTPFVPNWHIDAIAEHLEAVSRGQIQNLLINIPPGHMKSLTTCVFWPMWEWTSRPELRYIFASHSGVFALRDAGKSRDVVRSEWYQERWGDTVQIVPDQDTKQRFQNTATGFRFAAGAGGRVTGERADRIVVDDPHAVDEIHSDLIREGVLDWWDQSMWNRTTDENTAVRVIVMQRLHQRDLAGHLLERGGWEQICLPEEYEPGRSKMAVPGLKDPRKTEGELLWPKKFGPAGVAEAKETLGTFGYPSQYQQRPASPGGSIFKRESWQFYKDLPPKFEYKIASFDTAFETKSAASYSVGTVWGLSIRAFYLLDLWRARVEFSELKRAAVNLYGKWKFNDLLIEDKASGKSLIQELKRETRMPVRPVKVDKDKVTRAWAVQPLVEAERCYLPESAPWLYDYLEELSNFPGAANDDQVDSTTQALAHLRTLPGKFAVHTVAAVAGVDVSRSSGWNRF